MMMQNAVVRVDRLGLPSKLQEGRQFAVWNMVPRPGKEKPDKEILIPRASDKEFASCTDPETWGNLGDALAVVDVCHYDGIARALLEEENITFIDLDNCRNPETGEIEEWAMKVIRRMYSYTELSPSGTGVHIFVHGKLPPTSEGGRRRKGNIEMYCGSRFATLTGHRIAGTAANIEDRQAELDQLYKEVFAPNTLNTQPQVNRSATAITPSLSDDEIIERASRARNGDKFRSLWSGDIGGYSNDDSAADLALCSILAFWTTDESQIERLFSMSALARRDKWTRRADYRRRTITEALNGSREHYTPYQGNGPSSSAGSRPAASDPKTDQTSGAIRLLSAISPSKQELWPDPPRGEAFEGLAGEFVEVAEQHTEADPVALLVSFLTAFGCCVGRGPHAMVGATRHDARLYTALVGRSSKARKGDSWMPARLVFELVDPLFTQGRIQGGIASGEGLISVVRDPMNDGDPGVTDKRLLVIEPELARLFDVMNRQGNTLNPILRDGWDRGNLQSISKNSPIKATDAHICILAHVTLDELRRKLTDTDVSNGFGNRFAFFAVKRSKELPEPELFEGSKVEHLADALNVKLSGAARIGRMERDADARALWRDIYHDLSAERDGLVGSLLARAEAQVLRLSLLYALLDGSDMVGVPHLESARALWEYSERSVDFFFGDATGDSIADQILGNLRQRGKMTRTDIYHLFSRHVVSARIGLALDLLTAKGLARGEKVDSGGGRPIEVWEAVNHTEG